MSAGGDAGTAGVAGANGRGAAGAGPAALEVVELSAAYGPIDVLRRISLRLGQGEVLALLGPNGAGKTTLLRAVSGHLGNELRVTSGSVLSQDRDLTSWAADRVRRAGVCLVPEGRAVFPNLTVRENLWMWTHCGRRKRDAIEEIAFRYFPMLAERRNQLAGTLSGGQQQMLALSRALSTEPRVLLVDELSMGLAPVLVGELYDVVRQICSTGVSMLLVEQSAAHALAIADRIGIVVHGRLERTGDPDSMAEQALELYLS